MARKLVKIHIYFNVKTKELQLEVLQYVYIMHNNVLSILILLNKKTNRLNIKTNSIFRKNSNATCHQLGSIHSSECLNSYLNKRLSI